MREAIIVLSSVIAFKFSYYKIIEKMIPFLIIIHHGYVEIFIKIKIFGIFPVR